MRYRIPDYTGRRVGAPVDNDCYMGHVIAVDHEDHKASLYAKQAIEQIKLVFAEEDQK